MSGDSGEFLATVWAVVVLAGAIAFVVVVGLGLAYDMTDYRTATIEDNQSVLAAASVQDGGTELHLSFGPDAPNASYTVVDVFESTESGCTADNRLRVYYEATNITLKSYEGPLSVCKFVEGVYTIRVTNGSQTAYVNVTVTHHNALPVVRLP